MCLCMTPLLAFHFLPGDPAKLKPLTDSIKLRQENRPLMISGRALNPFTALAVHFDHDLSHDGSKYSI